MKRYFAIFVFAVLAAAWCVPSAIAQASGTVKGVCKDSTGAPVADGIVVWANQDNGQKYALKTNKKGEYFSLGIAPGAYVVTLYKNADDQKANKELFRMNKFQVQLDENTLDFDLKKEQENTAKGQGLTPEQLKAMQEQQEKNKKEVTTVKSLNEKLAAANAAIQAQDYDTAIAALGEANQMDPSRDLIWFKLGDAYRLSANKQTDSAEKQKRLDSAVESYQKAVQLKQAVTNDKDPNAAKSLAAYYNNLAEAYAKAGRTDDAIAAFDKVIASDPNRADAYYWKGVNLIGKATLQGDKMAAPPGTADAFQKYLELQPTGTYADAAKQMLASIGASVETTFGTTKKKPAPKK